MSYIRESHRQILGGGGGDNPEVPKKFHICPRPLFCYRSYRPPLLKILWVSNPIGERLESVWICVTIYVRLEIRRNLWPNLGWKPSSDALIQCNYLKVRLNFSFVFSNVFSNVFVQNQRAHEKFDFSHKTIKMHVLFLAFHARLESQNWSLSFPRNTATSYARQKLGQLATSGSRGRIKPAYILPNFTHLTSFAHFQVKFSNKTSPQCATLLQT